MWQELGPVYRVSGTSGTATLDVGSRIIKILAHSAGGGSFTMPDGKGGTLTITLPASDNWFVYDPKHLSTVMKSTDSIVFTGTGSYVIECSNPIGGVG